MASASASRSAARCCIRPRLLLLDEPLASLDDRLKQQILPFLKRVKDETGLPMLYVSHARAEIDYLADRTWRMEESRLVA